MLPGMIKIDDLDRAGKVLLGQIPDPDGPVSDDDFGGGPLPTPAPSLGIDAEAELFGGFDGSHIGSGLQVADGPAFLIHGGLREHAAELALACAGALSLDPPRPSLGFGGHDGDLDAVHQHIHFLNVLFANHGQDELFGATDFLLVVLGDLRANRLGGAFDGFGGNVQAGQQFHRLAGRSKRHLTAHHSLHVPYARRGLQTSHTQFDVSWVLSFRAMGAQVIRAAQFDHPQHGQQGLGTQFLVMGRVATRTGNRPLVRTWRIVSQHVRQRGSPGLEHG